MIDPADLRSFYQAALAERIEPEPEKSARWLRDTGREPIGDPPPDPDDQDEDDEEDEDEE